MYLQALFALLPILIICGLMIGLRWSAARAGLVGLVSALVLSYRPFQFELEGYRGMAEYALAATGSFGEAFFTTLVILWIIFPALCIYHLSDITGSLDEMREGIERLSADPRILAILIAWFFSLFMEGAAGFGTSVALSAPFLVGMGFPPVKAVVLGLIGHSIGVSFGAIGTPVFAQEALTEFSALEIASATGLYHTALGWMMLAIVVWLVNKSEELPGPRDRSAFVWTIWGGLCFVIPLFVFSRWVGPELPTMGGALFGGMAFTGLLYVTKSDQESRGDAPIPATGLIRAGAPYLVLVGLVLVTRMIPTLQTMLSEIRWEWTMMGSFSGGIAPLYHPGTMLFLGFVVGGVTQGGSRSDFVESVHRATDDLLSVTVALVAMLGISRLMVHAGMVDVLAETSAQLFGPAWPLAAPFVGTLGTFVTGSATASNILFTEFQSITAASLNISKLQMVAVQGFGAGVGNMICPHNIIAAGATVGIVGQEGPVLKRTLVPCLIYSLAGGMMVWLMVFFG